MKNKSVYFLAFALILSWSDMKIFAQDTISGTGGHQLFELLPVLAPWFGTSNPASLATYSFSDINSAYAGFLKDHNEIKTAQQPETTTSYFLTTEGFKKIKNMSFYGLFSYQNHNYDGVYCNGTMMYNSLNPFIVGDTVPARQSKERFDLSGKVGMRLNDRLSLALGADYNSAIGARQKDPRNRNIISSFEVTPGLIYYAGKIELGLSFSLFSFSNELSYEVEDPRSQCSVFKLRGMGYFIEEPDIDYFSELYKRSGFTAGVQSSFGSGNFSNTSEVKFSSSKEEVRSGSSYILLDGIVNTNAISFSNMLRVSNEKTLNLVSLNGSLALLSGDDIRQKSTVVPIVLPNGYTYSYSRVETILWTRDKHLITEFNLNTGYRYLVLDNEKSVDLEAGANLLIEYLFSGRYPVENNGSITTFNLTGSLFFKKAFRFRNLRITPGIETSYRQNLSSELILVTSGADKCFPDMVNEDFEMMKTPFLRGTLSIRVEALIHSKMVRSLYFDPRISYATSLKSGNGTLSNYLFHTNLGIIF